MYSIVLFCIVLYCRATHTYYEFQHLGHHVALGSIALGEIAPLKKKAGEFSLGDIRKFLLFPDSDGDVFAIGTLSMGRILKSWESSSIEAGAGVNYDHGSSDITSLKPREYFDIGMVKMFHTYTPIIKFAAIQCLHIQHHAGMALLLLHTLVMIPLVSIPLFLFPDELAYFLRKYIWKWILERAKAKAKARDTNTNTSNNTNTNISEELQQTSLFSPEVLQFIMSFAIRLGASVGLHSWLWFGSMIYLLFYSSAGSIHTDNGVIIASWTFYSVFKGFIYLYLSELFLYGFCMHPFMGYFLGVHRSGGNGFGSLKGGINSNCSNARSNEGQGHGFNGCQPTMSTYGYLSALFSMNLTHHVEHHDFPGVPWNKLC